MRKFQQLRLASQPLWYALLLQNCKRRLPADGVRRRLAEGRSFSEGGLSQHRRSYVRSFIAAAERMRYVYLIQSVDHPGQRYVGSSDNVKARLNKHNEGGSPHTAKFKPWKLVAFIGFGDESRAAAFEQYLKSGSGRAFANKHLW